MKIPFEQRFTADINGITYTVGIATKNTFDSLTATKNAEAITDSQNALILLCESTTDGRRHVVFGHEWIHAALGELGAEAYAAMVGCSLEDAKSSEERLCCFLGPILGVCFCAAGVQRALAGPVGKKRKSKSKTGRKR